MRFGFIVFCVCFGMSLFHSGAVHAQAKSPNVKINDIKFDETLWSQTVLDILNRGTSIIDKDTLFDVPPPPENDSEQTLKDLDDLVVLSKTKRSQAVIDRILLENRPLTIMEIFARSRYLDKADNVKTYALIEMADYEMQYFTVKYKKHYLRPRPNVLRADLDTVISNPPHPAYPSGHAGQSWLAGLILSYIDPDDKAAYMKFSESVGFRREIAGVHYHSDSLAGRHLAEQVFEKLMENKVFVKKINDAKESFVKPDLSQAYVVTEFDDVK